MRMQFDEANKLIGKCDPNLCSHNWEKEYYLGSSTGDYRCSNCGATISREEYKKRGL